MFGELEAFMNEHLEFEDRDLVLDFFLRSETSCTCTTG